MNALKDETACRRMPFTLIELLTVITVIGILMAILFPVAGKVRERARELKARAEMNGIILAIKSYESTYGVLPGSLIVNGSYKAWENDPKHSNYNDNYDILMQLLTKVPMTAGGSSVEDKAKVANSRNVVFLDSPSDFATKGYVDPWGNRYSILMDLDYNGTIVTAEVLLTKKDTILIGFTLNGSVFVYSYGKDGGAGNVTTKDDLLSWE